MKNSNLRPIWFNTPPAAPSGGGTPPAAPSGGVPPGGGSPPAAAAGTPPVVAPTAPAPALDPWFKSVPTTWRDDLVGLVPEADRPAAKNVFERVPSIDVFANNYFQAQQTLRRGLPPEDVPYLPKNATPEQVAEYRAKVDVPATADKYELALEQGLVLGENDRAAFNPIFNVLHAANVPTPVVSTLVNEYLKLEQNNVSQVKLQDDRDSQEATLALKRSWGVDFERNKGLVEMFFVDMPADVRESFMGARMADGKAVFNHPQVLQFFVSKQREVNPLATVVASAGSDGAKALNEEIAALEAKMGTDEWYRNDALGARYRELITAREQLQKK